MVFHHLGSLLGLNWAVGEKRPWLLHYRCSKWFILLTVTAAVFTDIFLYAVIVPVVPFALEHRVGKAQDSIQSWVSILVAVYGGALALFSPLCGWAADASPNRRLPLVLGLAALGGATIMLNLGRNIAVLIVGRILQGISAAVVWCVGLALLADTVNTNEIGETMGYVFVAMSVAILAGPLLGGVVFEKAGYNAVFAMAYALIGVDIAFRFMMIEKKDAKKWLETDEHHLEIPGTKEGQSPDKEISRVEGSSSAASVDGNNITASKEDPKAVPIQIPDDSLTTSGSPQRRAHTMWTLIKSRRLLSSLFGCMVVSTLMTQFDSVLPLYVKETFGWNSTGAGLVFLPIVIPSFLSPLVGWAIDKYGPRWFAVAGFIAFAPVEILLRLVDHDSLGQKVLLCALLVLIGVTLNFATPPLMVEITYVVEQKEKDNPGLFGPKGAYAQAYGLFNLAWAGGCLIGPLWAGFVREKAGWGTMAWSLALLSFVTAVPVAIWTGGSIFDKNKRRRRDQVPVNTAGQETA